MTRHALQIASIATALALLASGAAGAEATNPMGTSGPTPGPARPTPQPVGNPAAARNEAPAALDTADRDFVEKALASGNAEVQEAQLAKDKAKSKGVKNFADHMMTDHSAANDKLKSIAAADGVQSPSALDAKDQKQLTALQKLKGASFDRRYIRDQNMAHKQAVALFKKEAATGTNAQLKQFATDTLPTLEQHLADLQSLSHHS